MIKKIKRKIQRIFRRTRQPDFDKIIRSPKQAREQEHRMKQYAIYLTISFVVLLIVFIYYYIL